MPGLTRAYTMAWIAASYYPPSIAEIEVSKVPWVFLLICYLLKQSPMPVFGASTILKRVGVNVPN